MVRVSGVELMSETSNASVQLGGAMTWKAGPFSLDATISANGLGSRDKNQAGLLTLRSAF